MSTRRIRNYELYSTGAGDVSNEYGWPKPWVIDVRAKSIKQAYYLVANGIICPDLEIVPDSDSTELKPKRGADVGITFIDHSHGPEMLKRWRFTFDISEVGNCWGL